MYTVAQAANHPHLAARNAFTESDHPMAGRFKYPQNLISMTGTPPTPGRAPLLGEHKPAILSALGYSIEKQRALHAARVNLEDISLSSAANQDWHQKGEERFKHESS